MGRAAASQARAQQHEQEARLARDLREQDGRLNVGGHLVEDGCLGLPAQEAHGEQALAGAVANERPPALRIGDGAAPMGRALRR
eukprot:7081582-Lingulodinium_polyedra.AAC.1